MDFKTGDFKKGRKEGRHEYLFTEIADKPVYLVCGADLAVIKEYRMAGIGLYLRIQDDESADYIICSKLHVDLVHRLAMIWIFHFPAKVH